MIGTIMPFTQATFAPIGAGTTAAPGAYSYITDDPYLTAVAADYFDDKRFQLNVGDLIFISAGDRAVIIEYQGPGEESIVIAPKEPEMVLFAAEFVDQEPSSVGSPIQITFGAAQGTVDDPAMIDANGVITINQSGYYVVVSTFDVGRIGSSGGTSHLFIRGLLNGVQVGNSISTLVDNPSIVIPEQFSLESFVPAGSLITAEVVRDAAGVNRGGLITTAPTGAVASWNASPSAAIRIFKVI